MRIVVSFNRLSLKSVLFAQLAMRNVLTLVGALSFSFGMLAEGYADEAIVTGSLRGSQTEIKQIQGSRLRGAGETTETGEIETLVELQEEEIGSDEVGIGQEMIESASYLRRSLVPVVMYRDAPAAEADRSVAPAIPDRPALRHSLMHSANVYGDLRGPNGQIGETVRFALRGSYSSRAKLERAKSDRAKTVGALTGFLPKLTGVVDSNITPEDESVSTVAQSQRVTLGVELSMPLYTSGVNLNTYRQARQLSLASDYSYLAEEHRVALEAVAAHINLRLNRRIERTLKDNVSATQRLATIARKLYEAGDASLTDVAIAKANVEGARAELDLARKTREETQNDYESLTGQKAPPALLESNYASLVPGRVEDAIAMAIRRNPTLISSRHTALAGTYAARVARGRYGPQVNLYGAYDQDVYRSGGNEKATDWTVGVRLKVPLFDASLSPTVNAARHDALESEFKAMDQSRLITRQVRRQWSAYHSAKRRVGIVRNQVKAVSLSVEGARREYQAGFRSITDVLNDQMKLARAKITLESASHEKMLTAYELAFTTAHPAVRELVRSH